MPRQLIANSAAVATHHPHGAAAAIEVLRVGGNAVDAAVAAMLALCVVVPGSVGLGGYGGSAVIYLARKRRVVAIDFDSRAPLAYRDELITADPECSYYGARAVTVPAVVAGLELMLREFGSQSWREVAQPAIRLAEEGFEFDSEHQRFLERCLPKFDRQSLESLFAAPQVPRVGDCWRQPDLAQLMRRLAEDGPLSFYEGDICRTIVRYLQKRGGILTEQDFRTYRPRMVDPLSLQLRGFELYTPPPPSGGITSLGIIATVEKMLNAGNVKSSSAQYNHVLAEAMKLCWAERQQFVGDPDVVTIPLEQLLSDQAAQSRAEKITRPSSRPPLPASRLDAPHTSNVIAIDQEGNLVSLTATQGWMYGSHLVVDGLGLVLNHGMSRFDYVAGHPNAPAPGKRMQHNMSPLVGLRDGQPALAVGMPGGPKIVNVTAQLALDVIAFGASPAEAISVPRVHTIGDEPLLVSAHMLESVITALCSMGHEVRREDDMGGPVNVLVIDPQARRIDVASGEATGTVAGW